MTFAQVYDLWSQEHYPEITQAGILSYKRAYDIFEPLHGRKFRDLRLSDYQPIIDSYAQKGYTYSTLSKYKQLVTQMSRWAIREEILTTNYASYIRLPKEQAPEKETFSQEEINLLEEDGSEASMIILMLIYTGMRIGELFSLPVKDCHGPYVVGGEKTEAGRDRVIPIRPEGRRYFDHFLAKATGDLLLSGYCGHKTAKGYREHDYYPLLDRLGIARKTPHCARHTYASWAVSVGMRPETLQRILGHASYSTTAEVYVHQCPEDLVKAVEVTSKVTSEVTSKDLC